MIMKMKKNAKGFTLVELVVVIAIIGVLATILVPSMINYIKKARLKSANSNAKLAYNAAADYITEQSVKGVSPASLFGTSGKFSGGCVEAGESGLADGDMAVSEALTGNGDEAGVFSITMCKVKNNETALLAQWKKTDTDEIMGQYPDSIQWDNWRTNHADWTIGTYVSPI
jgi:type IV pilus assembly protein PilA